VNATDVIPVIIFTSTHARRALVEGMLYSTRPFYGRLTGRCPSLLCTWLACM